MTTLVPAYRDYKSASEAKEAYLAGKDWKIADAFSGARPGAMCSCADFPGKTVTLRYGNLRKVTTCLTPRSKA